MIPASYDSVDDVQKAILSSILYDGTIVSPREQRTLESRSVSFTLSNPRARCVLNPRRKWSMPLALGEICWHLSGSSEAEAIAYYAPVWRTFADAEGRIRGSCYGSKIFTKTNSVSRWDKVCRLLERDPATRRAVLYFSDSEDHLNPSCADAACAMSLQFMIRDGRLDAVVAMRSNDAIWGLPYDLFLFTFLQELIALQLGVGLGAYSHFAASMHLYSRHWDLAQRILQEPNRECFSMPQMMSADFEPFLQLERTIRAGRPAAFPDSAGDYWRDLGHVLELHRMSRAFGWAHALEGTQSPYRSVLLPLAGNSPETVHSRDMALSAFTPQ